MPAKLPPEDLDRITLAAARELLDDPEQQIARWKARRINANAGHAETGLAQASGLGPDVFVMVEAYIHIVWDFARAWLDANHGNVEAGLLDAAIIEMLRRATAHGNGPPPPPRGNFTDAEIQALAEVVTREVASAIKRQATQPTNSGSPPALPS